MHRSQSISVSLLALPRSFIHLHGDVLSLCQKISFLNIVLHPRLCIMIHKLQSQCRYISIQFYTACITSQYVVVIKLHICKQVNVKIFHQTTKFHSVHLMNHNQMSCLKLAEFYQNFIVSYPAVSCMSTNFSTGVVNMIQLSISCNIQLFKSLLYLRYT